ncbi:hypothetical protein Psi01_55570 [Planobispora siamensis]|uniref:Uncharacterized protein n=2 Tax=Planobispora siamensis TaxID=936338 RepID=A0A8J3SII1_9ACTN|nr:hypothetical protein Psi01_55570 [Planobispora siamensis]
MDDLEMLRDLGAELEHRPPASLARQRDRLPAAGSRGGTRSAGPRRRWVRWPVMGLAAAATVVAVTVTVPVPVPVLVMNAGESTAPDGGGSVEPTGALNILVVGTDSQAGAPASAKARTATPSCWRTCRRTASGSRS